MSSGGAIVSKFQIGDLVWAKMKGFSPWPGKIVEASAANMRKPPGNYRYKHIQCVYFFGSNNFAWIQEDAIKPYQEFKEQNCKLNKSHAFKEAIEKIEEYIKKGGDDDKLETNATHANDKLSDSNNEGNDTNNTNEDVSSKGNCHSPSTAINLPSIDEEIATIFTDSKSGKNEEKQSSGSASSTSSAQRDYSRTPFKSKFKKSNSSANANNDDDGPPPTKKTKPTTATEESTPAPTTITKSPTKPTRGNLLARTSQLLLDSNTA
ncbi:putative oxidoreductase GLYR1-like isoform X1, partial [Leptotrombidium deliense]